MARLIFPEDFDERAETEAAWRGYLSRVRVQLEDGRVFPLVFIDPVRLNQDLAASHPAVVAEVGLVVVPDISRSTMQSAVDFLAATRFFDYFRPLQEGDNPWEL